MDDSPLNAAERPLQRKFSLGKLIFLLLLLFLALGVASDQPPERPDRTPLPERVAPVRYERLAPVAGHGVALRGLWKVAVADSRFGGLSGLAVRPYGNLLAVTDSGSLVDLPRPRTDGVARVRDLQGGPGWPTFKKYRDSEALLLMRDSRSSRTDLWVTFENRHSLYLYDQRGRSAGGLELPDLGWSPNKGAEALTHDGAGRLLLIGEKGRDVLIGRPDGLNRRPLTGATGGIADAVRLPDGRILVAVREIGFGLTNRLAWLERDGAGYRLRNFMTLPLGALDNVEGLAAEALPNGGARIWAVTDNDFSSRRPTLLMTFDLPAAGNVVQHNGR